MRAVCLGAAMAVALATEAAHAQQEAPVATVDVSRLPLNFERLQRALLKSTTREERDGLNLRYVINVFGEAPRLQFFTREDNLRLGPVPYGGPTHNDMLQMMTPQEFRSPVMDFGSAFRWLADKAKDRSK